MEFSIFLTQAAWLAFWKIIKNINEANNIHSCEENAEKKATNSLPQL